VVLRRPLDAVLVLDKPSGMTSNGALQAVKRLYRARKAGHAGTLDPLASGVLPILFGEATKFASFVLDADKEYRATVKLGETTSTADAEGEVIERRKVDLADAEIEAALSRFRGEILQTPPMHSALKRDGRPLYELARAGLKVERAPRPVLIRELRLVVRRAEMIELVVRCSKGTYVRTLAEDVGAALGTGAHLAGLVRTAAGGYRIEQAVGLEELERMQEAERDARLVALDGPLAGLARIDLDTPSADRFRNGQAVEAGAASTRQCAVYGGRGEFLGVGEIGGAGDLRPVRLTACVPPAAGSGRAQAAE
jgi:tRNA pseudouridine55 synthase